MNITLNLPVAAVQQILQILSTTPLAHSVSNPLIQAISSQAEQQVRAAQAATDSCKEAP